MVNGSWELTKQGLPKADLKRTIEKDLAGSDYVPFPQALYFDLLNSYGETLDKRLELKTAKEVGQADHIPNYRTDAEGRNHVRWEEREEFPHWISRLRLLKLIDGQETTPHISAATSQDYRAIARWLLKRKITK